MGKIPQGHICLDLPRLKREEFVKLTQEISKKGARFDPEVKKWHIRPSLKDQFLEFLPGENKLAASKGPNENSLYLKFPQHLTAEEFTKVKNTFKDKGAEFDWKKHEWYIQPELKDQFKDYLPPDVNNGQEKIPQEHIYLDLPRLKREEFIKLTQEISKKGARFEPEVKKWYIDPNLKEQFQEFLPDDSDSKYRYEILPDNAVEGEIAYIHEVRPTKYHDKELEELEKELLSYGHDPEKIFYVPIKNNDNDVIGIKELNGWIIESKGKDITILDEGGNQYRITQDSLYTKEQAAVLQKASQMNLSAIGFDITANPKLNVDQMKVVLHGMEGMHPLEVGLYADPQIEAWKMEIYRYGLQGCVRISKIQEVLDSKINQEACLKKVKSLVEERRQEIKADIEIHKYQATPDIVNKFIRLNHLTGKRIDFQGFYRAFKEGTYKQEAGQLVKELGEDFFRQKSSINRKTPKMGAVMQDFPVR